MHADFVTTFGALLCWCWRDWRQLQGPCRGRLPLLRCSCAAAFRVDHNVYKNITFTTLWNLDKATEPLREHYLNNTTALILCGGQPGQGSHRPSRCRVEGESGPIVLNCIRRITLIAFICTRCVCQLHHMQEVEVAVLQQVVEDHLMWDTPILVLANKQDLVCSLCSCLLPRLLCLSLC